MFGSARAACGRRSVSPRLGSHFVKHRGHLRFPYPGARVDEPVANLSGRQSRLSGEFEFLGARRRRFSSRFRREKVVRQPRAEHPTRATSAARETRRFAFGDLAGASSAPVRVSSDVPYSASMTVRLSDPATTRLAASVAAEGLGVANAGSGDDQFRRRRRLGHAASHPIVFPSPTRRSRPPPSRRHPRRTSRGF